MTLPGAQARLQVQLGVTFGDPELLATALRHRSACMDRPLDSNERMEFLGDSVVGMVVCEWLYAEFGSESEGYLAKAKAFLASEQVLADAALTLGLHDCVEVGRSESCGGPVVKRSTLADAFEAVVAAVLLDRGIDNARRVVLAALAEPMERIRRNEGLEDYKSELQELLQARTRRAPDYRIVAESGADHDKTFTAQALMDEVVIGQGVGRTKKEAEQAAAGAALQHVACLRLAKDRKADAD